MVHDHDENMAAQGRAHDVGMVAHNKSMENNHGDLSQVAAVVSDIAQRLDNLEGASGSPAPAQPAGSQSLE